MIQHIMLWNYKEEVREDERAHIEGELVRLMGKIPALRSLEYGPVVGGRNQTFEHCFVMKFDDPAGLAEYAEHPAHVAFAALLKAACAVQVVTDFEVVDE